MLANLRALFGAIVDIVLLRRGPEILPASVGTLAVLIAVNGALSMLLFALFPVGGGEPSVLEFIAGTLVPLLWYWVAFTTARKPERFVQTMIALFGVNIVFQPPVAPLMATLAPYMIKQDPPLQPPVLLNLLALGLLIWVMVVWIRIVRAAFEWPYFGVIVFIAGQILATILVGVALFETPPKPV